MPSARAITRSSRSAFSNVALAADDVVDDGRALVGHAQAHRALPLVLAAEAAVAVLLLVGVDLLAAGRRAVGVPAVEQLLRRPRRGARRAGTGRPAPRPSRSRASAARRRSARRSRASSARGRCPRCAARARRRGRGRAASCTVPSGRRRCAARRSGRERSARASGHRMPCGAASRCHADRCTRLARRRARERRGARRRARLPLDPDLQPEPARLEAARVLRGGGRRLPRGDGRPRTSTRC